MLNTTKTRVELARQYARGVHWGWATDTALSAMAETGQPVPEGRRTNDGGETAGRWTVFLGRELWEAAKLAHEYGEHADGVALMAWHDEIDATVPVEAVRAAHSPLWSDRVGELLRSVPVPSMSGVDQ